jgi:DNA invertase Pin-like site-specific DNA recombinase
MLALARMTKQQRRATKQTSNKQRSAWRFGFRLRELSDKMLVAEKARLRASWIRQQPLTPTTENRSMAEANASLQQIPTIRITTAAHALAMLHSRQAVKRQLQAKGEKVSHYAAREITVLARQYLAEHREELMPEAKATTQRWMLEGVFVKRAQRAALESDAQRTKAWSIATLVVQISRGMKMIIGYARVSTDGQTLDAQRAALAQAGAHQVFAEKISGAVTERKALARAIAALGPGDILLVTRLDRLARSTRDLLNVLDAVAKAGAGFKSLADAWADTTTAHGRLMLTVLGGLAEFERELIRARTDEGRKRAQARGVRFGRKLKLTAHQRQEALARREAGEALAEIGRSYNVSHSTISRLA